MIFKDELCTKVLAGKKTQTRRVKKETEYFVGGASGSYDRIMVKNQHPSKMNPIKWMVGRTYAVQPGRGKKAVGRFKLLAIREERLREITADDARAEGVPIPESEYSLGSPDNYALFRFAHLWDSINKKPGTRWGDNPVVWALTFQAT